MGHAASRGIEHSLLRRRPRGTRGRATWRASDRCRVQARLRRVRLAAKRAANRRHRQRTRPPGWTAGRTTPAARLRRGAPRERAVARDRHHGRQLGRRPPASSRGKRMRHRSRRLTREHHARERAGQSLRPWRADTTLASCAWRALVAVSSTRRSPLDLVELSAGGRAQRERRCNITTRAAGFELRAAGAPSAARPVPPREGSHDAAVWPGLTIPAS